MVREVITVNIGQCGVQISNSVWLQYCTEHGISNSGRRVNDDTCLNHDSFRVFFEETNEGQYVPRNVSVDLEPNVMDEVRNGSLSSLFRPEFLINGKEDAANNFARGHYTTGREIVDDVHDKIRKLVDQCDNVQGFIFNHSIGGGTGSGLGSLLLEKINTNYGRKLPVLSFDVIPSPHMSSCVVEPYNALLCSRFLCDYTAISLCSDNEAIYKICQKNLEIPCPSFDNINRLICKIASSMTASLRFEGEMNVDLTEFQTNLVPFPRLHFMISSMSPIYTQEKLEYMDNSVKNITDDVFRRQSFFSSIRDFDNETDEYMATFLNYRGDVQLKNVNEAINWVKKNRKMSLVDWCPTGFRVGLNDVATSVVPNDEMGVAPRSVAMIGNNTSIIRVFMESIASKFDVMYSQRAYVHWYVGEGMEEGEFTESREDLGCLEKDYLEVMNGGSDDESDDDNDF